MNNKLILLFGFCLVYACAPSRFVKPLEKKQQAVNLALGGALINYNDITIPLPLLSATYGYGCTNSLTAFGGVNITTLLYGSLQLETGVTKRLAEQNGIRPAVSISPELNMIYRSGEHLKMFPQLDLNAYWEHNRKRNFFYAGISNWFELSGKKAFGAKQRDHWFLSPQAGETFVRKKWDFTIEAKLIAPNIHNPGSVVIYKKPFHNYGAAGIYISYTRKL